MERINRAIKMRNMLTGCGQMFPAPDKHMLVSTLLDCQANNVVMEQLIYSTFMNKVMTRCLGYID